MRHTMTCTREAKCSSTSQLICIYCEAGGGNVLQPSPRTNFLQESYIILVVEGRKAVPVSEGLLLFPGNTRLHFRGAVG